MSFAQQLITWQRKHGRKGLPWQGTRDPYRVWLSEVMLQQTQVAAVVPYFNRFIQKYPNVEALAAASQEEVLQLWAGLGYYARGRNLHAAALEISRNGFPQSAATIAELPGVGRSTAAAIAAFAFGERAAILDGNVKRVLSRFHAVDGDLWEIAERQLPKKNIETYTQALMDLGATVCTRKPDCAACPVKVGCAALKAGRVHEFPAPRVRKALPQRTTTWFVYRNHGAVLLEKRPSPGIWGGLWCFPEKPLSGKAGGRKLPVIEHGFTHFRLRIQPRLHDLRSTPAPGIWLDIEDAVSAAVPTPVRKLLQDLRANATRRGGVRR